jgi:CheY-like chemotaxis protein
MDAKQVLLIAEGNDEHFLLTTRYLEQKGITNRIVRFMDGRTLLDFFAAIESFNLPSQTSYLLLLDIDIPRVNGPDVLRQIRQSDRLRHLPVIMLTASADRQTIDRCYSLGCAAFFTKPPHGNDLVDALKNLSVPGPAGATSQTL